MRTPVRKALLAGSVTPATYGRAFGFERMMDTLGAIIGPATALVLLPVVGHHYPTLFALTLIPGLLAVAAITLLVRERERKPVPHISFGDRLRALPRRFRKFLVAVGLFGAGDFAHTLLILLATQKLAPVLGATKAASVAVGLYVAHNVCYAGFALVGAEQHGMGFGVLATVNGVGDFLSSVVVGVLWTAFGTSVAFGYSAVLFAAGAALVWRLAAQRE